MLQTSEQYFNNIQLATGKVSAARVQKAFLPDGDDVIYNQRGFVAGWSSAHNNTPENLYKIAINTARESDMTYWLSNNNSCRDDWFHAFSVKQLLREPSLARLDEVLETEYFRVSEEN